MSRTKEVEGVGPEVTDGAAEQIATAEPYTIDVEIVGTADLIFHRWNCEGVDEKAKAAKGSKAKKTDNVESYVYRLPDGTIGIPGEYLRQAIIHAAKFIQDPRSPRKSAMDLFKAGVISDTKLSSLGAKTWDYLHKCRVMVQRNGVNRVRPAFLEGWKAKFRFTVLLPEYISESTFHLALQNAGRLVGLADFRPTYGRFLVTSLKKVNGN